MQQAKALGIWQKLSGHSFGRWIFSRAVCVKAPYFMSIRPVFDELSPGHAVARLRKRRRVQNHIGTVHAIAIANLCEFAAGTMSEVTTPIDMRWIPKSMNIDYQAKAATSLRAVAAMPLIEARTAQDVNVHVDVFDANDHRVVQADITMYLTPRG